MPHNIVDERLPSSEVNNYKSLVLPILKRVFAEVNYTIAVAELGRFCALLNAGQFCVVPEYDAISHQTTYKVILQFKYNLSANIPPKKYQNIVSHLNDVIELVTDANLYVEQKYFAHYINIIRDEIIEYLNILNAINPNDLASHLFKLRVERLDNLKKGRAINYNRNSSRDYTIPDQMFYEMQLYSIHPKTALSEARLCIQLSRLIKQVQDLCFKFKNILFINSNADQDTMLAIALSEMSDQIEDFESKYHKLALNYFAIEKDLTYSALSPYELEFVDTKLQALFTLFNGSNYTLAQFRLLRLRDKRYILHRSEMIIDHMHDPDRDCFIRVELPILADQYFTEGFESAIPDLEMNEIVARLANNQVITLGVATANLEDIKNILESLTFLILYKNINIKMLLGFEESIRLAILKDPHQILKLYDIYKIPFSYFSKLNCDFVLKLLGATAQIDMLIADPNLSLDVLLTRYPGDQIFIVLEHASKILQFCKATNIPINDFLSLDINKISFLAPDLDKFEFLVNRYFLTINMLHVYSTEKLTELLGDPMRIELEFNQNLKYYTTRFKLDVIKKHLTTGEKLAAELTTRGYLNNLSKLLGLGRNIVYDLKNCGVNYTQVCAIIKILNDIHNRYADLFIFKYVVGAKMLLDDNINIYSSLEFIFSKSETVQIFYVLDVYHKVLFATLNTTFDSRKFWVEPYNLIFHNSQSDLEISDRSSKVADYMSLFLSTLTDGTLHINHLNLYNNLLESNLSSGYLETTALWKQQANNWRQLLTDNLTPSQLFKILDHTNANELSNDAFKFWQLYACMYKFKALIYKFNKEPMEYAANSRAANSCTPRI